MSKKKSVTNLHRRSAQRKPYDLVLIVCEGSVTEPNYLEGLRAHEDLSAVNIIVTGESDSDPMSVVNYAIDLYEKRAEEKNPSTLFDSVYCLIDHDEHSKFDAALNKARDYSHKGKRNIITVIRSYPCFEYWYLCHFSFSRAGIFKTGAKTASDVCISLLNPHWQAIFGTKYDKKASGTYPKLAHLTQTAITHSKQALKDSNSTGETNPSTEVHLLIEYLINIKKTNNSLALIPPPPYTDRLCKNLLGLPIIVGSSANTFPAHPFPADSVGLVAPRMESFEDPLRLECGRVLPRFDLMIETYGTLNADASNAILICHALSGHHHAAGYHTETDSKAGWWDTCIGPSKAIDTNLFFVVALNNIGGCNGSTGPTSPNPENDNRPYGPDFPLVTVRDWVNTQALLADRLGIAVWHAVVGGSLGGMQALQWAVDYPERLKNCAVIASTPKLSAQNIAFNEVARQSILSDPDFHAGRYLEHDTFPKRGLILARMVGHITYLSDDAMKQKFGRDLKSGKFMYGYDVEFQVESYLRYQGEQFSRNFDANTYLIMTKALDYFDPARDHEEDLTLALSRAKCRFLIISFTTDWRFSPSRSEEIVDALIKNRQPVSYLDIDAPQGHDSFLFPIPRYVNSLRAFLTAPVIQPIAPPSTASLPTGDHHAS